MAIAEVKHVEQPRPIESVILMLTEREARTLRNILDRIGGIAESTARGEADAISRALAEVGVRGYENLRYGGEADGNIYFRAKGV